MFGGGSNNNFDHSPAFNAQHHNIMSSPMMTMQNQYSLGMGGFGSMGLGGSSGLGLQGANPHDDAQ